MKKQIFLLLYLFINQTTLPTKPFTDTAFEVWQEAFRRNISDLRTGKGIQKEPAPQQNSYFSSYDATIVGAATIITYCISQRKPNRFFSYFKRKKGA